MIAWSCMWFIFMNLLRDFSNCFLLFVIICEWLRSMLWFNLQSLKYVWVCYILFNWQGISIVVIGLGNFNPDLLSGFMSIFLINIIFLPYCKWINWFHNFVFYLWGGEYRFKSLYKQSIDIFSLDYFFTSISSILFPQH